LITVNENTCKGCGLCVASCPKKIMALSKEKINAKGYHPAALADPGACISCAFCAVMCPDACIVVEKNDF
jgi:2-oxoglutarate ferredoxin oxidoreductase subunit delta